MEVLIQRTTHDGTETISREGTRQDGNITERRLGWFIENVGDLVLKILRSDEGVQELFPASAQHGVNLTACTAQILVVIETFPKGQQRLIAWLGTRINKNADFGIQDSTEGIEEPTMGVDFLRILLLQAEHHLRGWETRGVFIVQRTPKPLIGRDRYLRSVFELCMLEVNFLNLSQPLSSGLATGV